MDLSAVPMERLPSGRHQLTREAVFASQRGRLLVALIAVVGERGWTATRIADVVAHAGVSRQTFYQHFANLDACFVEAFQVGVIEMLRPIDAKADELPDHDWRGRIRTFWDGYEQILRDEAGLARSMHIEILRASDDVIDRRAALFAVLADRIRRAYERGRKEDAALPARPPELYALIIGGLDEMIRERLRTLGPQALDGLARDATDLTITALGGDPAGHSES